MGHSPVRVPPGRGDVTDVSSPSCSEQALILLSHCSAMKRQETRLRQATLLLLLLCAGAFLFAVLAPGRWTRGAGADDASVAAFAQQRGCPSEAAGRPAGRFFVQLQSEARPKDSKVDNVMWSAFGNGFYLSESQAVVFPESGRYFVHLRFLLRCNGSSAAFGTLRVLLNHGVSDYGTDEDTRVAARVMDGLACVTEHEWRTVSVGHFIELSRGNTLSVQVTEGYHLIATAFFSALRL